MVADIFVRVAGCGKVPPVSSGEEEEELEEEAEEELEN